MSNIYENVPKFESEKFSLWFVDKADVDDLLEVYSDKNSLPFFNSDNCDGDNFYYPTKDKMEQAIDFWLKSYQTKWFVRWVIIDKISLKAIGTIELFNRTSEDKFNGMGVLRLDLKIEYEKEEVITKVPNYAIERIANLRVSWLYDKKESEWILNQDFIFVWY